MVCVMLCALLAIPEPGSAQAADEENPCLKADAATEKQIDELNKTKSERNSIRDPGYLKPWMDEVKEQSKAARAQLEGALQICRNDRQLGPRTRRAAVSRLKKRVRVVDETDKQMEMMQALGHPQPRIDPSVLRVLER